jgi:hypothetical protein
MILSPEQLARAHEMWTSGVTIDAMALAFQCSEASIARLRGKHGWPMRNPTKHSAARKAAIAADIRAGMSHAEIGRKYRITKNVVNGIHRGNVLAEKRGPKNPNPGAAISAGRQRQIAERRGLAVAPRPVAPPPAPMATLPPLASVQGAAGASAGISPRRIDTPVQAPPVRGPGAVRAEWLLMPSPEFCELCRTMVCKP